MYVDITLVNTQYSILQLYQTDKNGNMKILIVLYTFALRQQSIHELLL